MARLQQHLDHIRTEVVPERGAAQEGLGEGYVEEIEARAQPPHLVRGLEQWNAGRFFEQHETLEWLWRATDEPVRDAFKGIILSGVGALHVQRRNRRGALAKWTGALGYLEPFEGLYPYGIDIAHLRGQVRGAREALLADEEEPPDWEVHLGRIEEFRVRWELRVAEPLVTALLRRFDRAWQDSPLGVEPNMEGLSEEEAKWVPAPGVRSIRDLIVHLGTAKELTANRCFGDGKLDPSDVAPPERWRKLNQWLVDAHEAVREPLGFLRDEELESLRAMFGREMPIEQIVEAGIEHDFYHAGEINRLRELYRVRDSLEER
ncbi:MAG: DUF309 domain-containing protein [Chloroflexota bacterium]|nr:DUF309 domain-containing protein [Chloroflexota bacterium]